MYRFEVEVMKRKTNGMTIGAIAKLFEVNKAEFRDWFMHGRIPDEKRKQVEDFFELSKEQLLEEMKIEIPISFLVDIINGGKESIDDYCNQSGEARSMIHEIEGNIDQAKSYLIEFQRKLGMVK